MTDAPTRHIIHADMDAFYASVEQHDRPELRGQPVLVGGSAQARGVVAAASYEAREFGCRSAMPMKTAVRLCPHAQIVSPRFPRYRDVSSQIMDVFRSVTPLVEPLSLDEAFLDVTQRVQSGGTPRETAHWIRARVAEVTGLTVSCGVAATKSVAKIASDMDKPDGLTVVPPGTEREFLAPLSVRDLWGVGPKTADRLTQAGISTIGELAERPLPWLIERFGVRGEWFHRLALGLDDRDVEVSRETKSVSSETTFAEDIGDLDALAESVKEQARAVGRRLQRADLRARTVQIKLRLSDFTTFTRQRTLPGPTDSGGEIEETALQLLAEQVGDGRRFRLVGVGASNLIAKETFGQLSLFAQPQADATGSPEGEDAPQLEAQLEPQLEPRAGPPQDESPTQLAPPSPRQRVRPPAPHPARLQGAVTQVRDKLGPDALRWADDPALRGDD
ncbi:MAG: DNA polymerase IV [Chloroflexi bacterium]|nr:DNA polymerase IV [Chloroflexota bacterium]